MCELVHKERSIQDTEQGPRIVGAVSPYPHPWGTLAAPSGWWESVYKYPSSLTPWAGSPWGSNSPSASRVPNGIKNALQEPPHYRMPSLSPPSLPLGATFQIHDFQLTHLRVSFWGTSNEDILGDENHCVCFMDEGTEFQGHMDASPMPSQVDMGFTPGYSTACKPQKPQGSSRWEDLPWDSPPSTPMLVNIIHSSPTDETLGSIAGGYSSAPSISLLPMVNCSPETNDHSLMYGQKASKSPRLHHNAYVIPLASSHHVGALSSHIITQRRVSTGP